MERESSRYLTELHSFETETTYLSNIFQRELGEVGGSAIGGAITDLVGVVLGACGPAKVPSVDTPATVNTGAVGRFVVQPWPGSRSLQDDGVNKARRAGVEADLPITSPATAIRPENALVGLGKKGGFKKGLRLTIARPTPPPVTSAEEPGWGEREHLRLGNGHQVTSSSASNRAGSRRQ